MKSKPLGNQCYFADLCKQSHCQHPGQLGAQLMILLDGAIVLSQMCYDYSVFELSKKAAKQLLDSDIKEDKTKRARF